MGYKMNEISHKKIESNKIIIDRENGLIFSSEDEMYEHFKIEIIRLENEFFKLRSKSNDIRKEDFIKFESHLNKLIGSPDEVWEDNKSIDGSLTIFIKKFSQGTQNHLTFHVALAYLTDDSPSFIYLHFPTKDPNLVEKYRRGQKIYSESLKKAPIGAIDGDALVEGDEMALKLYATMGKLRSQADIRFENFIKYAHLRQKTIEDADEIWRSHDTMGNVLVRFIKEFPRARKGCLLYRCHPRRYRNQQSHALVFFSHPRLQLTLQI